jgi:hypothetical protein
MRQYEADDCDGDFSDQRVADDCVPCGKTTLNNVLDASFSFNAGMGR